ncbi:MAG: hypothetical protein AB7D33_11495 [Sphingobium sp.]
MNGERKVVGLRGGKQMAQNNALEDHELLLDIDMSDDPQAAMDVRRDIWAEDMAGEAPGPAASPLLRFARTIFIAGAAGWIAFTVWLFARQGFAVPAAEQIPYAATLFSIPLILIAVLYQLLLRGSIGEADRFARITSSLRKESEALDMRLAIVNQQLDTARSAMRDQAALLEQYGAAASVNLESAARTMAQHASTSAQQAEIIERAGLALAHQFGQLIDVMPAVEERAGRVSTALTEGSSALTDKVDRLETRLNSLTALLEETRSRTMNATQSLIAQLMQIQDASRSASDEVNGMADLSASRVGSAIDQAMLALEQTGTTVNGHMADLHKMVELSKEALDGIGGQAVSGYGERIDMIEGRLRDLDRMLTDQQALLSGIGDELSGRIDRVSQRFRTFEEDGISGTERLSSALDDLAKRTMHLDEALQSGNRTAESVIARSETLLLALDASVRELDEGHPAALDRLDERLDQSRRLLGMVAPEIERLEAVSAAILGRVKESEELLGGQGQQLSAWLESGERGLIANREQVAALHQAIEAADMDARRLADSSGPQLVATLLRIKETAEQAGERAKQALSRAIADATEELGNASEQALSERLGEKFQARIEEISAVADDAVKAAHVASDRLMRQLLTIADTTASIEQRIAEADQAAEKRDRDNFSSRSAVLIEALNSLSVDVTKFLSTDVGDTNWAAYLKGDRGVFTRRAVQLLGNREAGAIARLYDENEMFRDNVNRYIHDFEAMLRTVLTTRDGSSLGVTLLSSDIGKLYVALAQAIERLKN